MRPNTQAFKIFGLGALFLIAWTYPYIPGHGMDCCAVKMLSGLDCPGCGMSRAFSAIMHGNFSGAISLNPMSIPLFLVFGYFWLKALLEFVTGRCLGSVVSPQIFSSLSVVFVAGLFIQWIVKMII